MFRISCIFYYKEIYIEASVVNITGTLIRNDRLQDEHVYIEGMQISDQKMPDARLHTHLQPYAFVLECNKLFFLFW